MCLGLRRAVVGPGVSHCTEGMEIRAGCSSGY